jgi:polyphosphate glucokinase
MYTLSIDIGGTGIKMIVLDAAGQPVNERARLLTPQPASPGPVLDVIRQMLATQPHFDRVSVGFPGVVVHGIVQTAPNLDNEGWKNFDLGTALTRLTGVPVRVINDADLQGYGVIEGHGVELVLTLGTGLGAALFVNGHLVPNLELGHHPFKKGKTYEERVCDAEFRRLGKKEWSERVSEMIDQLAPIFNYDLLYLGGGNAEHIKHELPPNVRLFTNVDGMTGGIRLWDDEH